MCFLRCACDFSSGNDDKPLYETFIDSLETQLCSDAEPKIAEQDPNAPEDAETSVDEGFREGPVEERRSWDGRLDFGYSGRPRSILCPAPSALTQCH